MTPVCEGVPKHGLGLSLKRRKHIRKLAIWRIKVIRSSQARKTKANDNSPMSCFASQGHPERDHARISRNPPREKPRLKSGELSNSQTAIGIGWPCQDSFLNSHDCASFEHSWFRNKSLKVVALTPGNIDPAKQRSHKSFRRP